MKKHILLTISVLFLLWSACGKAPEDYAIITFYIGDVKKNGADIEIGEAIKQNDRIITGVQSSCDVKIGESIIRIKENSKVLVAQILQQNAVENTTLGLDVGKILCKPKKLMKDESFLVKTPTAVAGVRGTKFTVETDSKKTTRIKVFDGKLKVIRRIEKLETSTDQLLEAAPAVEEKEKVVITEKQVQETEKKVDQILAREADKGIEMTVVQVVEDMKNDVVVSRKEMQTFKVEDFKEEKAEMIAVQVKPREVIQQIAKVVEMEKELPKPDGRLLVTRYDIYFIKNGKVLWEGKVVAPPVKVGDRIFIASGDYVYCASLDGPVVWRKNILNDGKVEVNEKSLLVYTGTGVKKLDLETGQE
jgi:hypothetical protein